MQRYRKPLKYSSSYFNKINGPYKKYLLYYIESHYGIYLYNLQDINIKDELYKAFNVVSDLVNDNNYQLLNIPPLFYFKFYVGYNENIKTPIKITYRLNSKNYSKISNLIDNYPLSNSYIDVFIEIKNNEHIKELIEQLYIDILEFSYFIESRYNLITQIKQIEKIINHSVNLKQVLPDYTINIIREYEYYEIISNEEETKRPDILQFFGVLCFYLHPKFKQYWIQNFKSIDENNATKLIPYFIKEEIELSRDYNYIYSIIEDIQLFLLLYKDDIENNIEVNEIIKHVGFKSYISEFIGNNAINIKNIIVYFIDYCNSIIKDFQQIKNEIQQKI